MGNAICFHPERDGSTFPCQSRHQTAVRAPATNRQYSNSPGVHELLIEYMDTQFKLLNFDEATQFRCWGDTTSMLGRRNLGWGDKAMGRHNLHSTVQFLSLCFIISMH